MEIISLSATRRRELKSARRHLLPKQSKKRLDKTTPIRPQSAPKNHRRIYAGSGFATIRERNRQILPQNCPQKAELENEFEEVKVTSNTVKDYPPRSENFPGSRFEKDEIGTVTGLAWTSVGCDILFVEALKTRQRQITVDRTTREVMQKSAQAAFSYAKARAGELGIEEDAFEKYDVHILCPKARFERLRRRDNFGDGNRLGFIAAAPSKRSGDDRRNHFKGQRPARRRSQRKLLAPDARILKRSFLPEPTAAIRRLPQEVVEDLTFIFVENGGRFFKRHYKRRSRSKKLRRERQSRKARNFDIVC